VPDHIKVKREDWVSYYLEADTDRRKKEKKRKERPPLLRQNDKQRDKNKLSAIFVVEDKREGP